MNLIFLELKHFFKMLIHEKDRIRSAAFIVIFIGVMSSAYYGGYALISLFPRLDSHVSFVFTFLLPGFFLSILFPLVCLSSFLVAAETFSEDAKIYTLKILPVSNRYIALYLLFKNFVKSALPVSLAASAAISGLLHIQSNPLIPYSVSEMFLTFILVFFIISLLLAAANCISCTAALFFLSHFHHTAVKRFAAILSIAAGSAAVIYLRLLKPESLFLDSTSIYAFGDFLLNSQYLPIAAFPVYCAFGLLFAPDSLIPYFGFLGFILCCFLLFLWSIRLLPQVIYRSLQKESSHTLTADFSKCSLFKSELLKEYFKISRNPVQSSQIILFTAIIALYYYNFYVLPKDFYVFLIVFNTVFSALVCSGIAARFTYTSFSEDKTGFLRYLFFPTPFYRFFLRRFFIHFLWMFLFSLCISMSVLLIRIDAFSVLYTVLSACAFSIATAAVNLAAGLLFIDLSERPAYEKAFSKGGISASVGLIALFLLSGALQMPFLHNYYHLSPILNLSYTVSLVLFIGSYLNIGVISLLAVRNARNHQHL